jgi:hypothetical protein
MGVGDPNVREDLVDPVPSGRVVVPVAEGHVADRAPFGDPDGVLEVYERVRHERLHRWVGDASVATVQHLQHPDELFVAVPLPCRRPDRLFADGSDALLRCERMPDLEAMALSAMQLNAVSEVLDEIVRRPEKTVFL